MRYLIRDGKVEFSGNKKDIIKYIRECYNDEYWVRENYNILDKDFDKLIYVLENIGLELRDRKPR